jgi:hypothetical protein
VEVVEVDVNNYQFIKLVFVYLVIPQGDAPQLLPGKYTLNGQVYDFAIAEPEVPDRWTVMPANIPDGTFPLVAVP